MNFLPEDREGAGPYRKFAKRGNTSRIAASPRLSVIVGVRLPSDQASTGAGRRNSARCSIDSICSFRNSSRDISVEPNCSR